MDDAPTQPRGVTLSLPAPDTLTLYRPEPNTVDRWSGYPSIEQFERNSLTGLFIVVAFAVSLAFVAGGSLFNG